MVLLVSMERNCRRGGRRTGMVGAVMALVLGAGGALAEPLADAVRAAVTQNPAQRAANADVQASAFELLALQGEFLPTLSLFGDAGANYVNAPGRLSAANNGQTRLTAEVGIAAEYTIFDGYRRANLVYRGAAQVDGAIFRLLDASETMALNAVEAYIDVMRHRHLRSVMAQNLARHHAIGRQVKDLVAGGRLPAADGFTIDERTLAARLALLDVERALADAEARYEAVIGHAPHGGMAVPHVTGLPNSLQVLTVKAVENSFQVRYANTLVRQTYYEQGIGEADLLPEVKLRAGVTYGTNQGGNSGSETDAFVGLQFRWEFFTGGRQPRRAAYTQRTREAMAERDEVVRDVQELAARAWNGYHTNLSRVQLIDRQLHASREIVEQYKDQFEAGTRSLLDLLSAERSYYNVRFQDVSAEASLAFSRYKLLAAQSRLASHFGIQPAEIPLDPTFQDRAKGNPAAIFRTDLPALE